jgi:hypothetical protein
LWQIVLQKSQKAVRLIFRQRTKQATIADQGSLKPVTEIACELGARRRSPPHYCSIVAPAALEAGSFSRVEEDLMVDDVPDISAEEAFALTLETACEDFEILQGLIDGEIQVTAPKTDEAIPANKDDHRKAHRALRAAPRIQMALAKSFLFNARRANRICTLNTASKPSSTSCLRTR